MVADVAELAARFRRSADSPECRTRRADDWVVRELTVRDSALIHPGTDRSNWRWADDERA